PADAAVPGPGADRAVAGHVVPGRPGGPLVVPAGPGPGEYDGPDRPLDHGPGAGPAPGRDRRRRRNGKPARRFPRSVDWASGFLRAPAAFHRRGITPVAHALDGHARPGRGGLATRTAGGGVPAGSGAGPEAGPAPAADRGDAAVPGPSRRRGPAPGIAMVR